MHVARESRRKVLIRARMRAGGLPTDVCIRDISSRGLLIQANAVPPRGTYVELTCDSHQIVGRVVWGKDRRFGIQTRERINVHALIHRISTAASSPREAQPARPTSLAAMRASSEANRVFARAMEFAIIGLFAAALVAALGVTAFETLSRPFATVSAQLGR